MKKLITLIVLGFLANLSFSQVVFQSNLSNWTAGSADGFFGTTTNVVAGSVTQVSTGAVYGSSFANLINTTSSHRRLTTQTINVVPGAKYVIDMWVAGTAGEIRVSNYDLVNLSYGSYTPYQFIAGSGLVKYTDSILLPAGCNKIEYIISFRNTSAMGIGLDSVAISGPMPSQINLPVTFEDLSVNYTMTDFGSNQSMLMVDPTNTANKVMRVIKPTGAQTWAGTTVSTPTGFASAIPFTAANTKMRVRVWSTAAGTPVRLKVENAANNTQTCETEALTVTAGGWDTLTFDFANQATGTAALNTSFTFNMASIFMDFNTAGMQDTFYFDDVMFFPAPPAALSQIDLPVTFEDTTVNYTMTDFGGTIDSLMVDPTNAANKVMRVIKPTGAQTWAGTTVSTPAGFASAIPFTVNDKKMSVRLWSRTVGTPILLKVEDASNGAISSEILVNTTVANGWDSLVFDFGNAAATPALNLANTYSKASLFFNFNTAGAQDTFYFDNLRFVTTPPATLAQIDLPVTFEDTMVDYTMTSFGGNVDSLMVDPTNAANKVMRVIKPTGAQTWAGTTVSTPLGFATAIPFTATDRKMSVRVWSPFAGKVIRLKVEDASNGAISCETEATTTLAGAWDTLTFDFANPFPGTPALNLANTYRKASIFFDFGNAGANDTYYFDDLMFGGTGTPPPPPPTKAQIDVTVTFEDTAVDYTMTSFGGNVDSLMIDPTNPANHVMRVVKTAGAQTWAGTTIGTPAGFATLLPFSATSSVMSVKIWSPAAGTVVRLKVEDANDVTHTCETETNTTVAGGWQILNFDFTNHATGTATLANGLANGWVYDKASIFFDFGNAGTGTTFYFDDVRWGAAYTSIKEISASDLSVYPNPTSNVWNVNSLENSIETIELYDLKGNLVFTSRPNTNSVNIDATNFDSGMYILKAFTDNGVATSRLIKN